MAEKLKIWFDAEADFLEVRFSDDPGYFRETPNINLMERVDEQGNLLGFAVEGVTQFKQGHPFEAELAHA
jgi:hypothetical protein